MIQYGNNQKFFSNKNSGNLGRPGRITWLGKSVSKKFVSTDKNLTSLKANARIIFKGIKFWCKYRNGFLISAKQNHVPNFLLTRTSIGTRVLTVGAGPGCSS